MCRYPKLQLITFEKIAGTTLTSDWSVNRYDGCQKILTYILIKVSHTTNINILSVCCSSRVKASTYNTKVEFPVLNIIYFQKRPVISVVFLSLRTLQIIRLLAFNIRLFPRSLIKSQA